MSTKKQQVVDLLKAIETGAGEHHYETYFLTHIGVSTLRTTVGLCAGVALELRPPTNSAY